MIQILLDRCRNDKERARRQDITIGKLKIQTSKGLAQGNVLSPMLFNIYLDMALRSSAFLKDMLRTGRILAYADDLVIRAASINEIKQITKEFQTLKIQSRD